MLLLLEAGVTLKKKLEECFKARFFALNAVKTSTKFILMRTTIGIVELNREVGHWKRSRMLVLRFPGLGMLRYSAASPARHDG